MYIRNKGTAEKPKYCLVESRRIKGQKHPQQKVLWSLGFFPTFEQAIDIWKEIAKDARRAHRNHIPIQTRDRQKEFALVKQYAKSLTHIEITAKLRNLRHWHGCLQWHQKAVHSRKQIDQYASGFFDSLKYNEWVLAVHRVNSIIYLIHRDGHFNRWKKWQCKSALKELKEIGEFYGVLKKGANARPLREGDGMGADRGIDGLLFFRDFTADKTIAKRGAKRNIDRRQILVQVKSGKVERGDVTKILGDVNNQNFAAGVLITLQKPTEKMRIEAAEAGNYTADILDETRTYPKIQILTIEGLLNKTEHLKAPPLVNPFAQPEIEGTVAKQPVLI